MPELYMCSQLGTNGGPIWQPTDIIEDYESLVWTERYNEYGDFTLKVPYHSWFKTLNLDTPFLQFSESDRIMQVETVDTGTEIATDNLVTVTGRDLTAYLMNRDSRTKSTAFSQIPLAFTGSAGSVVQQIIQNHAVVSATSEPIQGLVSNNICATTGGDTASMHLSVVKDTVYTMVKTVCDAYGFGFKITGTPDGVLNFYVYSGVDKSSPGAANYVLYTPDDGGFAATSHIESISNYKNHARVLGAKTGVDVYAPGFTKYSGLNLRTVVLNYSQVGPDATTTVAQDQATLSQLGKQALATPANMYTMMVSGTTLNQDIGQELKNMGDKVQVKDSLGVTESLRITELIYTNDDTGLKTVPTFAVI